MKRIVHGNHPFTEGGVKDTPIKITHDMAATFMYPETTLKTSNTNYTYLSTDSLCVGYYELCPGGRFDPPDYHPGDEIYYVLEGVLTMLNTEAGQVCVIKKGESLVMPRGSVHLGCNFTDKKTMVLAFIAPRLVVDQNFPTDKGGENRKLNQYKGKYNAEFKHVEAPEFGAKMPTVNDLGAWPVDGKTLRKEPGYFYHITEEKKLNVISGNYHMNLLKFFVSNDYLNVGELVMTTGGIDPRMTEPDEHEGDCLLYCESGSVIVFFIDTLEMIKLNKTDAVFIPPHTKYQVANYEAHMANVLFAVTKL